MIKKLFKGIGGLILLLIVALTASIISSPSKQENARNEAREIANNRLDSLRNWCENKIKASVINKSTLDMSAFDSERWKGDDGRYYALQEFSAKNKFGLEQNFEATCIETDDGNRTFHFVEKTGNS